VKQPEWRVEDDFIRNSYNLYLIRETGGDPGVEVGRVDEQGDVAMVPVDVHRTTEPTLRIRRSQAPQLVEALMAAGVPPEALIRTEARLRGMLEEVRHRAEVMERILLTSSVQREPNSTHKAEP
jgi:hypothetical protein